MSSELSVGDWRLWTFGYDQCEWYVLRIKGNMVQIGQRSWLVSASMWIAKDQFLRDSKLIGKGKYRWWWTFLPWRDCVTPFSYYK